MPLLRSMRADIALLAGRFVEQFAPELGKRCMELTSAAMHRLENHHWPSNICELAHEMKRLVGLVRGVLVAEVDLPPRFRRRAERLVV
jgi:transcriptional regulator of aroF, aroG, tyrA and aromatic amino acid transport